MNIPLVDLKRQHERIRGELEDAFTRSLDTSNFILGREVECFEREFAEYCGVQFAIGVASGTDALFLSLKALGVGPGDEVITTTFTFVATAEVICQLGAKPVLVDIDPETFLMDLSQARRRATRRTRVLLPVYLYGQVCNMDEIQPLATELGLKVVEDACQAHGARYRGRRAGSFGDIACFSHFPSKNLGALGDGGTVVTQDPELAQRVRLLRDHGCRGKYEHVTLGWNSRLDALQAAWLRVKLRYLDEWNQERRCAAEHYRRWLGQLNEVRLPVEARDCEHIYHCYVIRVQDRDELAKFLQARGISTGVHYPVPVHLQPAFQEHAAGALSFSEAASREVLSLPMFPGITEDEVEFICATIREWVEGRRRSDREAARK